MIEKTHDCLVVKPYRMVIPNSFGGKNMFQTTKQFIHVWLMIRSGWFSWDVDEMVGVSFVLSFH